MYSILKPGWMDDTKKKGLLYKQDWNTEEVTEPEAQGTVLTCVFPSCGYIPENRSKHRLHP